MNFEFATAARIVFEAGRLKDLPAIVGTFGQRVLLVHSQSAAPVAAALALPECVPFPVTGEPTIEMVRAGVRLAQQERCDVVVSLGGGSAIDAGKAIAALVTNGGDPLDYVEVVGKGQAITKPGAPFLAIPTTAGTGAEVTRNAVLYSPEHHVKVSIRGQHLLARVALVDPELTYNLPPAITASTGLDALTQLIEPFVSGRANPLTDALCREGMHRVARSLRRAYETSAPEARADMALASLLGGLALANAGLGAVHGFAAPLGGMYDAPHGALCAALLPAVFAMNARLVPNCERFDEVRRIVGDLAELCRALGVKPLREFGVHRTEFPGIIEKAATANSMKGNPVQLTPTQLGEILEQAF